MNANPGSAQQLLQSFRRLQPIPGDHDISEEISQMLGLDEEAISVIRGLQREAVRDSPSNHHRWARNTSKETLCKFSYGKPSFTTVKPQCPRALTSSSHSVSSTPVDNARRVYGMPAFELKKTGKRSTSVTARTVKQGLPTSFFRRYWEQYGDGTIN